jgi:hypothetical protein
MYDLIWSDEVAQAIRQLLPYSPRWFIFMICWVMIRAIRQMNNV